MSLCFIAVVVMIVSRIPRRWSVMAAANVTRRIRTTSLSRCSNYVVLALHCRQIFPIIRSKRRDGSS